MQKILPKKDVSKLVGIWMEKFLVISKIKKEGFTAFEPINDPDQIALDFTVNSRYSIKSFFLPQSEVMFTFQNGLYSSPDVDERTRVIFGVHPCDAWGIKILDNIFLDLSNPDPYWSRKREGTIIVGLGCSDPQPSCFCTSVGTGPFDSGGVDALLTEVDDAYSIEIFTKKGEVLFKNLKQASATQIDKAIKIQSQAVAKMTKAFETEGLKNILFELFESDVWKHLQQSCLGCGVCSFLCPTCHCFDIVDELQRQERVRNWDSCMFRIYSQEASGHNPRPSMLGRFRQRIMHKFAYIPETIKEIGCTGCGRCLLYCPVNLDIRTVLQKLREKASASVEQNCQCLKGEDVN